MRWYTPLLEVEERLLNSQDIQVCYTTEGDEAETGDYFDVCAVALKSDHLVKLLVRIYTKDIYPFSETRDPDRNPLHTEGEIEWKREKPLLPGLALNCIPGSDLLDDGFQMQRDASEDWDTTQCTRERNAIVRDINRLILPILDIPRPGSEDEISLSRKPLPFYNPIDLDPELQYSALALYKLEDQDGKTAFFAWQPGYLQVLNWTSPPIHKLNSRFGSLLSERFEHDPEHICEYLRFFCDFVTGEHGPFTIIESLDDKKFADTELDDDVKKIVVKKAATIEVAVDQDHRENLNGDEIAGALIIDVLVWYGPNLFLADFKVAPDGMVKMLDDNPLESLGDGVTDWSRYSPRGLELGQHPLVRKLEKTNIGPTPEYLQLVPFSIGSSLESLENVDNFEGISGVNRFTFTTDGADIRRAVVLNDLDLSCEQAQREIIFKHCLFRGDVKLSSIACESKVSFDNCVFEKTVCLDDARLKGRLVITNSTVLGADSSAVSISMLRASVGFVTIKNLATVASINLGQSHIGLGIEISNLWVRKQLSLDQCKTEGRVRMDGVMVAGDILLDYLSATSVWLVRAVIDNTVSMQFSTIRQVFWLNTLKIGYGKEASEENLSIDVLDLYGTEIEKNYLGIHGVMANGNINLIFMRIGSGLFMRHNPDSGTRNRIEGSLNMGGLQAPSGVFIEGAFIGKNISAKSLKTGELRLKALEDKDKSLIPLEVGGSIDFSQIKVTADAYLAGITVTDSGHHDYAMSLRRADIAGNLYLFMGHEEMTHAFDPENVLSQSINCEMPGGINLMRATVGADLNMSQIDCSDGEIKLWHAKIGHDILVREGGGHERAKANSFEGDALECGGDVDLTGLDLSGSVMMRQAEVAGRLITYQPTSHAGIPGCLNLKASHIGQAEISDRGFPGPEKLHPEGDHSADVCGIVLEQASIGRLSVATGLDDEGSSYPEPVKLKFMEVKYWDFNGEPGKAENYISFLGNDEETNTHNYYAVENTLMNQGEEGEGDKVHIAMHQKIEEDKVRAIERSEKNAAGRKLVSLLKGFFLGWISGYGTKVLRPSMIILFWWLISGVLFSYAPNIVPSGEALAATNTELREDSNPATDEWGLAKGLWVAIRFHLPIVSFNSLDEWAPTNEKAMVIPFKTGHGVEPRSVGVTPGTYAYIVMIFHFLLLPMAVFAASRKVFRSREVG